jgi:hypothetical protein
MSPPGSRRRRPQRVRARRLPPTCDRCLEDQGTSAGDAGGLRARTRPRLRPHRAAPVLVAEACSQARPVGSSTRIARPSNPPCRAKNRIRRGSCFGRQMPIKEIEADTSVPPSRRSKSGAASVESPTESEPDADAPCRALARWPLLIRSSETAQRRSDAERRRQASASHGGLQGSRASLRTQHLRWLAEWRITDPDNSDPKDP